VSALRAAAFVAQTRLARRPLNWLRAIQTQCPWTQARRTATVPPQCEYTARVLSTFHPNTTMYGATITP